MPSSTYKTTGIAELERAIVELGKKAGFNALTGALRDAAKPVLQETRRQAPVKSGTLRKGIRTQTFRGRGRRDDVATIHIGFHRKTAFYGQILERGADPHRIPNKTVGRGKNKRQNQRRLSFGGKVYSKVDHPGFTKRPMLAPAFNAKYRSSIDIFKARLRQRIILESIKKYGKSA